MRDHWGICTLYFKRCDNCITLWHQILANVRYPANKRATFHENCHITFYISITHWHQSLMQGSQTHGPPGHFVRPGMLFENFKIINIYVAKCFEKRCNEITGSNWLIPSAVWFPVVALQTKFTLSSKFLWNLGSVAKTSTHALSSSPRKHAIGFLVKLWGLQSFPRYGSSHCIPGQKFVYVSGELNHVVVGLRQRCVVSPLLFIV